MSPATLSCGIAIPRTTRSDRSRPVCAHGWRRSAGKSWNAALAAAAARAGSVVAGAPTASAQAAGRALAGRAALDQRSAPRPSTSPRRLCAAAPGPVHSCLGHSYSGAVAMQLGACAGPSASRALDALRARATRFAPLFGDAGHARGARGARDPGHQSSARLERAAAGHEQPKPLCRADVRRLLVGRRHLGARCGAAPAAAALAPVRDAQGRAPSSHRRLRRSRCRSTPGVPSACRCCCSAARPRRRRCARHQRPARFGAAALRQRHPARHRPHGADATRTPTRSASGCPRASIAAAAPAATVGDRDGPSAEVVALSPGARRAFSKIRIHGLALAAVARASSSSARCGTPAPGAASAR